MGPGRREDRLLAVIQADGLFERADRVASAGRFAEADHRKREGEEKLSEPEARLAQAKANEHLMDPYQRQRLRECEYQLGNARYGFFEDDWLTALLLFEALDTDYAHMGDPSAFGGGDWGGGDFGGGDFGGGDF